MCHICAKGFLKFILYSRSYWQNIKFSQNCPKFHKFTKVELERDRLTVSTLTIIWQGGVFASCEPLKEKEKEQKDHLLRRYLENQGLQFYFGWGHLLLNWSNMDLFLL